MVVWSPHLVVSSYSCLPWSVMSLCLFSLLSVSSSHVHVSSSAWCFLFYFVCPSSCVHYVEFCFLLSQSVSVWLCSPCVSAVSRYLMCIYLIPTFSLFFVILSSYLPILLCTLLLCVSLVPDFSSSFSFIFCIIHARNIIEVKLPF